MSSSGASSSSSAAADPSSPAASSSSSAATTTPPPTDSTTSPPPDTSTPPPTSPPPTSDSGSSTPPPDSSSNSQPTGSQSASNSNPTSQPPTSSGGSSSASSAASSPSSASSTPAPSTSTQTQTVIATAPDGSVYTSVVTSTLVSTPTIAASDRGTSSSSSHTGAIVGGVVGGVAGAAILATLLFFFCRARRRRDDFDGNFDPDRVTGDNRGTLPDIDLGADDITPYNYTPAGMTGAAAAPGAPVPGPGPAPGPGMPDMRQYGGQVPSFLAGGLAGAGAGAAMAHAGKEHQQGYGRAGSPPSAYSGSGGQPAPAQSSYYAPSSSDHHGGYPDYAAYAAYANPNLYPAQGGGPPTSSSAPSSPTNASFGPQAGMPPARDFRHPSPGPSLPPTDPSVSGSSSGGGGVIPSAKEREAMQYRRPGGLAVANPDGAGASGVVQHQDAGRLDATPEDEEPSEIPPRYDSIRHDA
ncbi:hypothetical protein BV20DRAFT_636339 [Pilatotrama ljubarskyi]|nr:hypothetical protein BV20DRAFT_636339 [Pilatotrama ljubarskyi]